MLQLNRYWDLFPRSEYVGEANPTSVWFYNNWVGYLRSAAQVLVVGTTIIFTRLPTIQIIPHDEGTFFITQL
jgi:hypothetical protein